MPAPTQHTQHTERKPRRGDICELELTDIDSRGRPTGQFADHNVTLQRSHVAGATLGARIRAEVLRRRGASVQAHALELLHPAPDAVTPRCPHFGACGGCALQDLAYPAQLAAKRRLVERALAAVRLDAEVAPCIGCDAPWAYRNKMDFTFGTRRWRELGEQRTDDGFALGLHAPGFHSKVLDVTTCKIQFEEGDALLTDARRLAREHGLAPWDLTTHTGFLRHLVLRKGRATGEILVEIVTSSESPELVQPFARALLALHPEITTLVQTLQSRPALTAIGERSLTLFGPGAIRERLLELEFEISAGSFFQPNTAQAERLFTLVRERVGAAGVVWDLYCGAGTIALLLARQSREVWGFEAVESAILDARRNAERNGIHNASFVHGDVASLVIANGWPRPDVCVTDPPRAGMHTRVLTALIELAPRRIVYVSCNPATAAPDVARLAFAGWRLALVQPFDLFPHTPHVECVFALERST